VPGSIPMCHIYFAIFFLFDKIRNKMLKGSNNPRKTQKHACLGGLHARFPSTGAKFDSYARFFFFDD
jgi:hypothetical protein